MKKAISILLALLMVAAMSVTVFAESDTLSSDGAQKEIPVDAKYVNGISTSETISADITWGAMEFTYSVGGTKEWNAKDHTYTIKNPTSGWTENGNTVKVVNHSNIDITASFTYTPGANNTLGGAFTYDNNKAEVNGAVALTAGKEYKPEIADNVTATLTLTGTPADTMTDFTGVGTVTVKIAPANAA